MSEQNYFVYKLIPPRPTFAGDMTDAEGAVMAEHGAYWTQLCEQGSVVAFGPVLDPAGVWGLAVVEAETEAEVHELRDDDPAVRSATCTAEIYPMLSAVVRGSS